MQTNPIRILIAKVGLDGHDRGAKFIAQALRDRGYEVIYTGIRRTPEQVAEMAVNEDVQVVGVSVMSGGHKVLCRKVLDALKAQDAGDIQVLAGGIIPAADMDELKKIGIRGVFGPGTTIDQIETFIQALHGPSS